MFCYIKIMGETQFIINYAEKERSEIKLSEDLPIDIFFPEEEAKAVEGSA